MNKIAFVVAVPLTAQAFLKEHFALLKKKYEVHLFANFIGEDESKDEFEAIGIKCHHITIVRKISIFQDIRALIVLVKMLRTERFASVHSVTPKAGLISSVASWLTGVPRRIHTFTGQVWATRKGFMRAILRLMDKIIAFLDTDILIDGEGQRRFLIQQGIISEKKSLVLANGSIAGVKLDKFVISDDIRIGERNKLGIPDDSVVYVFLGRLNRDKGIGELLSAFNQLVLECPKAKLLLYGIDEDGYDNTINLYPNIIKGENYFFPGLTKTPYRSLQAADVFVLPTWREGFGVSVLEAQALALPVITTDAYGVVDASIVGVTGLRCGVSDVDGLLKCMLIYYRNPELRKLHGAAGRLRVENQFDNSIVSNAWLDFYEKILDFKLNG